MEPMEIHTHAGNPDFIRAQLILDYLMRYAQRPRRDTNEGSNHVTYTFYAEHRGSTYCVARKKCMGTQTIYTFMNTPGWQARFLKRAMVTADGQFGEAR